MYLFSKKYDRTIQIDLIRKTNILNYQKVCLKKGDHLSIGSQQGAKASLVNKALVLEVLSLKKAFFKFEVNKQKKKKTYVSMDTRVFLKNKVFLYNFSKNTIGLLKNLHTQSYDKHQIHVETDALLPSNLRTSTQNFSEFLLEFFLSPTRKSHASSAWQRQKLSFYKIFL
jgi:hypothetical protein